MATRKLLYAAHISAREKTRQKIVVILSITEFTIPLALNTNTKSTYLYVHYGKRYLVQGGPSWSQSDSTSLELLGSTSLSVDLLFVDCERVKRCLLVS